MAREVKIYFENLTLKLSKKLKQLSDKLLQLLWDNIYTLKDRGQRLA